MRILYLVANPLLWKRGKFALSNESTSLKKGEIVKEIIFPTSQKHQFYGVMRGSWRLGMKTKYVNHSLISQHANFCNNRTMWTEKIIKKSQMGGEGKEPFSQLRKLKKSFFKLRQ